MDYNVTNTSLILLALFEVGAVAWVYGTERLSQDLLSMTGKRLSNYFVVCLKFLAPLLIVVCGGRTGCGMWWQEKGWDRDVGMMGRTRWPEYCRWEGMSEALRFALSFHILLSKQLRRPKAQIIAVFSCRLISVAVTFFHTNSRPCGVILLLTRAKVTQRPTGTRSAFQTVYRLHFSLQSPNLLLSKLIPMCFT